MNLGTLKAGDKVGIIKPGSWGGVQLQGLYMVTSANKVRVVVTRGSDGYARTFSTRKGYETAMYESWYRAPALVSEAEYAQAQAVQAQAEQINALWAAAEGALKARDTAALSVAVSQLQAAGV
jgi:hypothetical protein